MIQHLFVYLPKNHRAARESVHKGGRAQESGERRGPHTHKASRSQKYHASNGFAPSACLQDYNQFSYSPLPTTCNSTSPFSPPTHLSLRLRPPGSTLHFL